MNTFPCNILPSLLETIREALSDLAPTDGARLYRPASKLRKFRNMAKMAVKTLGLLEINRLGRLGREPQYERLFPRQAGRSPFETALNNRFPSGLFEEKAPRQNVTGNNTNH